MLAGMLSLAVPALSLVVPHGASGPILLLILLSIVSLPFLPPGEALHRHEKMLLWLFAAYFIWVLLSWVSTGLVDEGVKYVGRAARFALLIPVYLLLRRLRPSADWLFYGWLLGATGAGIWAILDHFLQFDYSHGGRASGATHPILFGDLALVMGLMILPFWSSRQPKWLRFLIAIACIMGLIASLLSASRGGWIAIPVLSAFLLWQAWHKLCQRHKVILVMAIIIVPAIAYIVPQTGVQYRIAQAQQDIERFSRGDSMNNSLGERFAMWQAAWVIVKQNPLTGAGTGNFIKQAHSLRDAGKAPMFNDDHYHAHNEYITVAAQTGAIGLILLLMVFLYPVYVFARFLRHNDAVKRSLATAGIVLVLGYMHFALSESIFHRSLPVLFYVYNVFALIALLYSQERNDRGESVI